MRTFTLFYFLFSWSISHLVAAQPVPQLSQIVISENVMYVKVLVNGRGPYNFKLDSGVAGMGCIDQRLAKELGLNVVGFEENSDVYRLKREFLVGVDKLGLGPITHSGLRLRVGDYNTTPRQIRIDGLVGRDFFREHLVTIDGPGRQMTISRGSLAAQSAGVLSYTNTFLVLGKIAQKEKIVYLDTGSDLPLLFPTASLTGIQYANTPNQRVVIRSNVTFVLQEAVINEEFVLGGLKLDDQKIYYSNKIHQISVGMAFLKDHVITLDQRNKLVKID